MKSITIIFTLIVIIGSLCMTGFHAISESWDAATFWLLLAWMNTWCLFSTLHRHSSEGE